MSGSLKPKNVFEKSLDPNRTRCEIYSKLTIKIPERRRRSGVFIVNFEHISPRTRVTLPFNGLNVYIFLLQQKQLANCGQLATCNILYNFYSRIMRTRYANIQPNSLQWESFPEDEPLAPYQIFEKHLDWIWRTKDADMQT